MGGLLKFETPQRRHLVDLSTYEITKIRDISVVGLTLHAYCTDIKWDHGKALLLKRMKDVA